MFAPLLVVRVEVAPDARLAEVVDARPDELADHVRMLQDALPDHRHVLRIRLGVDDDTLRKPRVIALGEVLEIVVAHDVERGGHGVLILPLLAPEAQRLRDGTRPVETVDQLVHLPRRLGRKRLVALKDLVADGPHHDAGMDAVTADDPRDVLPPVLLENLAVVAPRLRALASVEHVVHHQKPDLVAGRQELLAHGIVARADGIEARALELQRLAALGLGIACRAEGTVVVMDARAVDLDRLAIEKEAVLRVDLDRADTETDRLTVELLRVKVRRLGRPELRIRILARTRDDMRRAPGRVRHRRRELHRRKLGRDRLRPDVERLGDHVFARTLLEPDGPDDAAAHVPAARRCHGRIDRDNNRILPHPDLAPERHAEPGVAVAAPLHRFAAVDGNLRRAQHAVENKLEFLREVFLRQDEPLLVRRLPGRIEPPLLAVRCAVLRSRLDRPVMRHADGTDRLSFA